VPILCTVLQGRLFAVLFKLRHILEGFVTYISVPILSSRILTKRRASVWAYLGHILMLPHVCPWEHICVFCVTKRKLHWSLDSKQFHLLADVTAKSYCQLCVQVPVWCSPDQEQWCSGMDWNRTRPTFNLLRIKKLMKTQSHGENRDVNGNLPWRLFLRSMGRAPTATSSVLTATLRLSSALPDERFVPHFSISSFLHNI